MDSHEEILRRSTAIVLASHAFVLQWENERTLMADLLRSAREHISSSQDALNPATPAPEPFSWFPPLKL